ncbi:hypothetical protein JI752_016405 [Lysobacter sp. MMG2]|uniref:hypothetical protein n=1 Tax=Lysobacter sp. MMG2 TaxID=2801338 RepID=UPI001C236243|nr:hypothetical protein [Lysobacter sp. MMG2]MBU8977732.1 hypothetical protein [Lysobacter sp. MMG2]
MNWNGWALAASLAVGQAFAQSAPQTTSGAIIEPPAAQFANAPLAECTSLCAGQEVELELAEPVGSASHKNGYRFRLRLAKPLIRDGVVVVPAGTPGIGEVVHAQASRGGGKPGELLLAARFLELPDGPLTLRAMKLAARGKDNMNASLATSFVAGPFALFVHGGEIEIPAGTRALAKLAQDLAPTRIPYASPPHTDATAPAPEAPSPHDAEPASSL